MAAQFTSLATEADISYIRELLQQLNSMSPALREAVAYLNSLQSKLVSKINLSQQLLDLEISSFPNELLGVNDYGLAHDPVEEIIDAFDLNAETIPPHFNGDQKDLQYLLSDLELLVKRHNQVLAAKANFDKLVKPYATKARLLQILFTEYVEGQSLQTNSIGLLVNDVTKLLEELFPAQQGSSLALATVMHERAQEETSLLSQADSQPSTSEDALSTNGAEAVPELEKPSGPQTTLPIPPPSSHVPSQHALTIIPIGIRFVREGRTVGPTGLYTEAGYVVNQRTDNQTLVVEVLPQSNAGTRKLQDDIMPSGHETKHTRLDLAREITWLLSLSPSQRATEAAVLQQFGLINDNDWEALDVIVARLKLSSMIGLE